MLPTSLDDPSRGKGLPGKRILKVMTFPETSCRSKLSSITTPGLSRSLTGFQCVDSVHFSRTEDCHCVPSPGHWKGDIATMEGGDTVSVRTTLSVHLTG